MPPAGPPDEDHETPAAHNPLAGKPLLDRTFPLQHITRTARPSSTASAAAPLQHSSSQSHAPAPAHALLDFALAQSPDLPVSKSSRAAATSAVVVPLDLLPSHATGSSRRTSHELAPYDSEDEFDYSGVGYGQGPERKSMSKAPLLIRSSPGFGTGSYGVAPIPPEAVDLNNESDQDDDGLRTRPSAANSRRSRRRKSMSTSRSHRTSTSSISRRLSLSEEMGGPSVAGGIQGRFGTDMAFGDEVEALSDAKSVASSFDSDENSDSDSVVLEDDPPDNSPYPQVRASVAPTDNTTLSINTPRMWLLSILFSILGSSTNLFFSLRYPSVAITPVIALLLVHPLGLLWDFTLKRSDDPEAEFLAGTRVATSPSGQATSRSRVDRTRLWLSQGRWNEKEHTCVYVSSNVSFGFAFATDVIVEQTQFYKQEASITYQLLLTLSTQILGYTFAGLTRRFLVRPSGMIWPGTLMSAAMFTTLHKEENKPANGWTMSRWKFFYVVWLSAFIFYFLPGLLMPALSYFNVITWFAPDNVVVANLFGVVSGLGLFPVTFDWAQIAYIGSPLLTPFWAAMNVVGGLVLVMWIAAPIAYYLNIFYSSYMPMLSASVFDNTGKIYDVSRILGDGFVFDREKYSSYSRVFLPITYVLSYGLQFAGLASLLTHTACWHGRDIWTQWQRSLREADDDGKAAYQPVGGERNGHSPVASNSTFMRSNSGMDDLMGREDVHNRLMKKYKDAPMTWYLLTFVSMTAVGMFLVE